MHLVHCTVIRVETVVFKSLRANTRYRVKNRFSDIIINWERYGRNVKPGGHWEKVEKNGSFPGKSGGLANMLKGSLYFLRS